MTKEQALKTLGLYVSHQVELTMEQIEELSNIVEAEGDLHEDAVAYCILQDAMDKCEGLNGKQSKLPPFNCRQFIKENGLMASRFFSAMNTREGVMMREYIKANYPS